MRYYISDLHFYHSSLNNQMDCRGFSSVEKMHDYMAAQWNSKVRQGDDVVILGDVSLGNAVQTNEMLARLHGNLYLIAGNHDHFTRHRRFETDRFGWIKTYEEMRDNKRKVILCHYPIFCYNGQYRVDQEGKPTNYMLYGHVHNTLDEVLVNRFIYQTRQTMHQSRLAEGPKPVPCQMINCFCMFSDYVPLSLDEWIEVDRRRREQLYQCEKEKFASWT